MLRNVTRFDRLYLRQRGAQKAAYTTTDTYTLSFSILLACWTLPLETLASPRNYLAQSLDSSSDSTSCSLDSHSKYLTRHPDRFMPEKFFWKHFINIYFFSSENSLHLQYFSPYFKHIFLHSQGSCGQSVAYSKAWRERTLSIHHAFTLFPLVRAI